jgi:hypothetical protein
MTEPAHMHLSALDTDVRKVFRLMNQSADPGDALRCIDSGTRLSAIADSFIWFESDCTVKDNFVGLVADIVRSFPAEIRRYLIGSCDLADLLPVIVDRSRKFRQQIGRSTCLQDLRHMEEAIDDVIVNHLRALQPRSVWRILGFGGGSCYYERSIGQRLIRTTNGDELRLYRFDPSGEPAASDVEDVDLDGHSRAGSLKFDIVICRWVLHHVPDASRWDTIANATSRIGQTGALIIVEEGSFSRRAERAPLRRAYEFLVACEDVLVNGVLRPAFVDTVRMRDGSGFYLNYLTREGGLFRPSCRSEGQLPLRWSSQMCQADAGSRCA